MLGNPRSLILTVARGPNYDRFFVMGTESGNFDGRGMKAKINHHIGLLDEMLQIIALINSGNNFEVRKVRRASNQGIAHATLRTSDNNSSHPTSVLKLFEEVKLFHRGSENLTIFRLHGHEWKPEFLCHQSLHGQSGFDGDGIGFDEQIFKQRIKPFM